MMRFMMLMIPRVYQGVEGRTARADYTPSAEMVQKMMRYNEELAEAGVLIALDGLYHPAGRVRVSFSGGKTRVTEGTSAETKDVLGGYWMINVGSMQEAVDWAGRCPAEDGDMIEVRQVFEPEDFPPEQQEAAKSPLLEAHLKETASRRTRQ